MVRSLMIAFLLFTACYHQALACECVRVKEPVSAQEWVKTFKGSVFLGKVKEIAQVHDQADGPRGIPSRVEVTFEVETIWKGEARIEIKVKTGDGNGDCGYPFEKGERYFVAAYSHEGGLWTSGCSGTKEAIDAWEELRDLWDGRKPGESDYP